jgi:hypothetical protein
VAIQRMYPVAHFCSFNRGQGIGTHTAAGVWTATNSVDCAASCDDLYGSLDEKDYGRAVSMGGTGYVNNGQFEWTFGDPPLNVTISNLTLVGYFRTSSGNAVAIDSAPTVKFFVDPGTGTRDYYASTDTVNNPVNRNTQAPAGTFQRFSRSWASKPAGGAWTRPELLSGTFKAGIASDGTHGSGIDKTTGGSSSSFDVAAFWVELETTPSALYVDPIRQGISHQLRLFRRALRTFKLDVPLTFGAVEPGDWVWSNNPLLPWSPGLLSWQQVPLYVLNVEDRLSSQNRAITFLDLRDQFASFWSPLQVTGIDDQNSGLAVWHLGGSWSTTRNQIVYGQRPGDGLYQEVATDEPLLTKDGLLIQGGGDINYLLNSTFSLGATNVFTSWTQTKSGSATITSDTTDYLIDVAGLQRAVKTTTTAAAENCYISQTVTAFAANTKLYVRAWYRNESGADAYFIRIQRSVDSWYWNDSTPAWQAAVYDIQPALSATILRFTSKQIDVGAGITNISVTMGHYATVATGANVGHIYAIELQLGTIASWCRRDLLPTTTVAVTRVTDVTAADNSADFRVWNPSRGYFSVEVSPQWNHQDLADGEDKVVLSGAHDGAVGGAGMHQVLYYHRIDSMTGYWEFQGAQWATYYTGSPTTPAAGVWYKLAGRWTSEAEDEQGLTGQAYSLWVGGTKGGTESTGNTEPGTPTTAAVVYLGNDPTVSGEQEWDGHLKNLTIDSRCPTDAEMARM